MNNNNRLNRTRLAAFVSPEAPLAAFLMVVVVFIPPFYAGTMGLGLSVVGLIFGLTKLWDVMTDPVFGVLSDNIYTRWGRRRPWLVVSAPVLMICTYFTFVPEPPVSGTYFAFWMLLLYVGWTLASVSHISWAAEMSGDYHERSRISAYKQGAGLIGAIFVMSVVALADHIPDFSDTNRLQLIAAVLIVCLPVCILLAILAAPEPVSVKPTAIHSVKPFAVLLKNAPLRRLVLANLLIGIATGSIAGMFIFFATKVLALGAWSSSLLLPWFLSALLFLPVCIRLSKRFGKHKTLCIALIYYVFSSTLFLFLPEGNVILSCAALLFMGSAQAVGTYIPAAIMADVTDFDAVHSGRQRTGLYMSILQTSSKLAAAFSVGLSYPILELIGFDASPGALNSTEVLNSMRWVMVLFPGGIYLLVIGLMWNFPIDEARQINLRRDFVASSSGSLAADSKLTAAVVPHANLMSAEENR